METETSQLFQTDREAVLKHYGLTDKRVKEDVQIIKQWLSQQPHLPNMEEDIEIERFLLGSKFGIEKTKTKLNAYFTMRGAVPELFANRDPLSKSIINAQKVTACVGTAIQTDKYERIILIKVINTNPDEFIPLDFLKLGFMTMELTRNRDYSTGIHFIVDYDGVKLGHLLKLTPTMIKQTLTAMTKAFPIIIASIHYINTPTIADSLIILVKSILEPKIASRVHAYRTQEKLLDVFPAKCLPKDYGGTGKSISELKEMFDKEIRAYRAWFLREENKIADESKRPNKSENENLFGSMYGSFRKLDVD